MRTLYLLDLDGRRYGIWKDEIASITDVRTIHRIPLSPDCIAGVSVIDGRSTALADLGACIGLRGRPVSGDLKVFFVAGKKNDSGFVLSGGVGEMDVPPDAVRALPDYLKTPGNDTCILRERRIIPLINLAALYDRVHERSASSSAPALTVPVSPPVAPAEIKSIRLFKAGGEIFAFPRSQVPDDPAPVLPDSIAQISLAPRYVKGLAYHQKNVLPVISLAERMGLAGRGAEGQMAVAELSGAYFGFLIDEYLGSVQEGEAAVRSLPPAASTGWASAAVLYRGAVIPLLEPAAILSEAGREDAIRRLPGSYSPDGRFLEAFERTNVDVMEFSLLGVRHALPKAEVEDVLPFKPYRRLPDSLPIVIGITEHDGMVLPVLDLAMVFGRRSLETPEWKSILVKNGDFRAFVITERLYGERMLSRDIQRKVPIVLPYDLVYGCYPEGVAVRLILNVEALTVHFDKSVVRDLLPALTSEMAAAPSELVPSLLPEEHSAEEAATASFTEEPAQGARRGGETAEDERTASAASAPAEAEQLVRREAETGAGEEELRRQVAEEQAHREAEELSRREEEARRAAEEQARRVSEEAQRQAEQEQIRREAEELSRQAEREAARHAAEEKARRDADEERARRKAEEERRRSEAEECARRDAEGLARRETEAALHQQAEERARKAAEEQRKAEEEARTRQEAEEQARRAEEEKVRLAAEEQARRTAEERKKTEEEARARQEAKERARREAEAEAKRAEEEQQRAAAAAIREAEKISREREREAVPAAGSTFSDRAPTAQPGAGITSEERLIGQDRRVRKKYIAIAAGLVLVSLLYVGAQRQSPSELSDEGAAQKSEEAGRKIGSAERADRKGPATPEKSPVRDESLVLIVPQDRPIETDIYVVKKGDTLWAICKRFTGDPFNYPRVARDNSIANPDLIFPGQRVHLKQ